MSVGSDKAWVVDDEPLERFPLYTRGNVGEVFPAVVSPLTWSLLGHEAELGWRDAFRAFGSLLDSDFGDARMGILSVFGGYCYINASYVRVFAVRTPGLSVPDIDRQFFGESDAPPYEPKPGDKSIRASLRIVRTLVRTLRAKELPQLDEDKVTVARWLAALPDVETAGDAQLIAAVRSFQPMFRHLFKNHILTSFQATVGPGLVQQLCADKLGDGSMVVTLLAGIGSVESAAPSAALWDLGRMVAADATLTALFDKGLDGLEERLVAEPAAAAFNERFAAFTQEFGSRGPNEWEGSSPTWGTRPALALAAIDRMRGADADHDPRSQQTALERDRLDATAAVMGRLKGASKLQFKMALRSGQLFSQGRERSKTTVIRAMHGMRLAQLELARRTRDRGGPDALEDLWLVTLDELEDYVRDPKPLQAELDIRRVQRDRLAGLIPPFIFEGTQPPPETWESRTAAARQVTVGTELRGIAGCPGVARGRARIVLDPMEPRGLGPGDILVAPITDPSWTPLFVPAEAVVVDVGAQMSHAIIVSRELGIPAVVSVTDATRTIPDGAEIEVDGTQGTVRILALP